MLDLLVLAALQGGTPLLTHDTETPGDDRWEINVAATFDMRRTTRVWAAPLLDVNYGLGERIQLKAEIPWLIRDDNGRRSRDGLGKPNVGVKYRFLDEEEAPVAVSAYPQVEFNLLKSSADRGLVDRGVELLLPIQIQRRWDEFGICAEIGYAVIEDGPDEWLFGLAAGYRFSDDVELIGEVHDVAARDFSDHEPVFNIGTRVHVDDTMSLLFSAGRSFRGSASGDSELMTYLGIQFAF